MPEYGLFNDEGCFYGPCYTLPEAETELALFIAEGEDPDDVSIKEMCPDHEGHTKDDCEECYAEYDYAEYDEEQD